MANGCCKLVGNLNLPGIDGCITSINMSSKAEIISECETDILVGPTVGTVSITGYAVTPTGNDSGVHTGCPGKAGVSITWVRRYDCDTNTLYFIAGGAGSSYIVGDVSGLAQLHTSFNRTYSTISASSSSGPATIYMETQQEDGYGLVYTGNPISFDSSDNLEFSNFIDPTGPTLYLQSFSLDLNPGEIPLATYSFTFSIVD